MYSDIDSDHHSHTRSQGIARERERERERYKTMQNEDTLTDLRDDVKDFTCL